MDDDEVCDICDGEGGYDTDRLMADGTWEEYWQKCICQIEVDTYEKE